MTAPRLAPPGTDIEDGVTSPASEVTVKVFERVEPLVKVTETRLPVAVHFEVAKIAELRAVRVAVGVSVGSTGSVGLADAAGARHMPAKASATDAVARKPRV